MVFIKKLLKFWEESTEQKTKKKRKIMIKKVTENKDNKEISKKK